MTHPSQNDTSRVSTLELFFDLVFVFTITQVSDLVLHAHGIKEILQAFLMLTVIWWMYGGYAWLTNNVGTTQLLNRMLVLTAMAGFMVMALAVPHAIDRDGLAFGLGYLLVNVIHAILFTQAPDQSSAQAIRGIAPFNIGAALLIVVAGLVDPAWNWIWWVGAILVLASTRVFRRVSGFAVQPAHFVERHSLVFIIALGESIISIGLGAAGEPVTPLLVIAAVLGLALTAALWWSYFSQDEERAEHALSSVSGEERAHMALNAFGYAHLVILAGVVLTAAGIKLIIQQLHGAEHTTSSALLASGVALYLFGDVLFRRWIKIPSSILRLIMAVISLATIPVGIWVGGLAQIAALVALFVVTFALESRKGQ